MYKVGSLVIYGSEGVCKVVEIAENCFSNIEDKRKYYVLTQLSNPAYKVFVPCDNETLVSRMQKILSADEVYEVLKECNSLPEWIDDSKQRNKVFKEILSTYDRKNIISLAKLLYIAKNEADKKFYASDEEILKKIIKILYSELSLVFDIQDEEVLPFILGEIKCNVK